MFIFHSYAGVHPTDKESFIWSNTSVLTPLVRERDDEIPFIVPVSGWLMTPNPEDPTKSSSVLTYLIQMTIQKNHLGFMERTIMRSISQVLHCFRNHDNDLLMVISGAHCL